MCWPSLSRNGRVIVRLGVYRIALLHRMSHVRITWGTAQ
ncbi:hypothetical protein OOU_Y34scaffold00441g1 [Pyricularia oryzae Y34]|uniref:Uncharacterized protein n=1 Tax=Pyricularia oryzae (strain Y34) TaxID=1143189 RepID=A0AA97P275_PYRO3|nr:hypothetical protein OOU_Y34scaffold00441g1 [Pyricularia oryzae Y34]